ncbi:hypothetical protein HMPREF0400_00620 [Fusobacterium periodonticum 1_1_41FAA]|uniref:Uncharacterized protein n=1 Tax=Fusobacterium periodonticum 1_1_41FAA TaxID=469621 RepID=D6LFX2_9FUSO|nr:hypothetical protein HMPREF0400_00620 [Fusobacterium periodonticum 1_1_41FAA]
MWLTKAHTSQEAPTSISGSGSLLIYCRIIVSNMTDKNISEVTTYLNLETIAFIINNFY